MKAYNSIVYSKSLNCVFLDVLVLPRIFLFTGGGGGGGKIGQGYSAM